MAPVEYAIDEKNRSRQTWLYVPSSGNVHVHGFEEPTGKLVSSALDASRTEVTAALSGEDSCARLCLPLASDCGEMDEHIQRGFVASFLETNQLLRNQKPTVFADQIDTVESGQISGAILIKATPGTEPSTETTILYVAQGEIAHCTYHQADVLVSDRATTCHVVALYSYSCTDKPISSCHNAVPLCTMVHLDACTYDSCIRNAVEVHATHHRHQWSSTTTAGKFDINLDIHLVGGFMDNDATSRKITRWIMNLLIEIAEEYYVKMPSLKMILRTACVTAANHDAVNNGPVVRGLGLVCRTGRILVAHCVHPGPAMTLRMARLWVRGHGPDQCDVLSSQSKLSLIHISESEYIAIAPLFPVSCRCRCGFLQNDAQREFAYLFQLRDDKAFLKYCSTSPEHEEEDFCESNRASFRYILQHFKKSSTASGVTTRAPQQYRRAHRSSNVWVLQPDDHTEYEHAITA
jgi:Protein N-terminal asparagine amidohydrolase